MADTPGYSASDAPKITLQFRVETPENVVLTYQLAGPTLRCAAYLMDSFIRGMIIGLFFLILLCTGLMNALPGLTSGFILLLLFVLEWGYFVLCEITMNGRSLGKRMFGLRVIQERGYTITFWSSLGRNLLRAADMLPFFYAAGFLSMVGTRHFQRLGDLLAGTIVVEERYLVLPREPIIFEKIAPLNRQELSSYTPPARTLALIDQFLGRRESLRHVLDYERGHAISRSLAKALAQKLNFQGDPNRVEQFSMSFLAGVYVTFLKRSQAEEEKPEREESPVLSGPPPRPGEPNW